MHPHPRAHHHPLPHSLLVAGTVVSVAVVAAAAAVSLASGALARPADRPGAFTAPAHCTIEPRVTLRSSDVGITGVSVRPASEVAGTSCAGAAVTITLTSADDRRVVRVRYPRGGTAAVPSSAMAPIDADAASVRISYTIVAR